MSCCKRTPGGVCEHDLEIEREKRKFRLAQLEHDLKRPGNDTWNIERIQKEISSLESIPEDASKCHICPACKKILPNEITHKYERDICGYHSHEYSCNNKI